MVHQEDRCVKRKMITPLNIFVENGDVMLYVGVVHVVVQPQTIPNMF